MHLLSLYCNCFVSIIYIFIDQKSFFLKKKYIGYHNASVVICLSSAAHPGILDIYNM